MSRQGREDEPGIAPILRRVTAEARAAWPDVAVADESFAAYLTQRLDAGADLDDALARLEVADLLLACGCATGDPVALRLFELHHLRGLRPVLGTMGLADPAIDEVLQRVRFNLLVGREGAPALITQYAGRGPLSAWVKVTTIRVALRMLQQERPAGAEPDEVLRVLAAPGDDPELVFIKQTYGDEFRAAFGRALAALPARARALLLQHYLDGLSTYALGTLYRVNQATVSRWLTRARRDLLAQTRALLMAGLRVGTEELESIVRLVGSRLEISLREVTSGAAGNAFPGSGSTSSE